MTSVGGDAVSISTVGVADHEADLEKLFREYHEWNKQEVKEAIGGGPTSTADIEAGYNIQAMIADDFEYLHESASGKLLVAHDGGCLLGCVYLRQMSPNAAEVRRLFVRPPARGQRLGRRLMETLMDTATAEDYERVLLNTGPHTEVAQMLYTDLGFEPTEPYESEIPDAVHDNWHFMELTLERDRV